jgi:hypothetical protein
LKFSAPGDGARFCLSDLNIAAAISQRNEHVITRIAHRRQSAPWVGERRRTTDGSPPHTQHFDITLLIAFCWIIPYTGTMRRLITAIVALLSDILSVSPLT